MVPLSDRFYKTVIHKNTFYFFNQFFENNYEAYINSITHILMSLRQKVNQKGLQKVFFENILFEKKENGLRALLALTGLSNEFLKRIITILRITKDKDLSELMLFDKWGDSIRIHKNVNELSDTTIVDLLCVNEYFRKGVVNLLWDGCSIPFLVSTIPLFELKKLSFSKLSFDVFAMMDSLVRYKEKGSYSGKKGNNPELLLEQELVENAIPFDKGDVPTLKIDSNNKNRAMDFIIPNKKKPYYFIECSYLATTSSGQGDKSKAEIQMAHLIKQRFPYAKFIGFVDGIGWYVRTEDLKRMLSAYDNVFTFHSDEIKRCIDFIKGGLVNLYGK